MHVVHHSMTGMWHIARPTLGVAVVQLTFVESHPMSMARHHWSGLVALHMLDKCTGIHLGARQLEWHWDLEIGCERKGIATGNMTTNTKKK